jgi:hypothetical protein
LKGCAPPPLPGVREPLSIAMQSLPAAPKCSPTVS